MQKAVTKKEIRVGIVGADTKASWAKASHVPAIKGLPGLKRAAVATRNEQSAREAAEAFGADRWFSDPFAMIHDDRIDLITIAVKVPAHCDLVLAAVIYLRSSNPESRMSLVDNFPLSPRMLAVRFRRLRTQPAA